MRLLALPLVVAVGIALAHAFTAASALTQLASGSGHLHCDEDRLAVEDLTRAIKLNDHPSLAHKLRAKAFEALENYDRAILDISELLIRYPDDHQYYGRRADLYDAAGQHMRCLWDRRKVVELAPDDEWARIQLGWALLETSQPREALRSFEDALVLDRELAAAHQGRGRALRAMKEYFLALRAFSQSLTLEKSALTYCDRGWTYLDMDDQDLAIADFDRAIQRDPRFAHAYYGRGRALYKQSEYVRAIRAFDDAIQIDADYANAYHARGVCHCNLGHFEQALEDLTRTIQLEPEKENAYYWRARVHDRLGHTAEAEADRKKERELDLMSAD